jgi:hypothetical protein
MSSRHRTNRISGQFATRLIEMMESPAYRVLSLAAHRLLSRIEIEHAHHGGKENGKLPVTYNQFVEYGIHRHSIGPSIREATALGFLEVMRQGRAGNADARISTLFRLTYRACKGMPGDGTHEWRKITDINQAGRIARTARKTKHQCRKMPRTGDGIRHRKSKSPVPDSVTTERSAESITTSISRGGDQPASTTPTSPARRLAVPLNGQPRSLSLVTNDIRITVPTGRVAACASRTR